MRRVERHHFARDGLGGLDRREPLVREEDAIPRTELELSNELARRHEDRAVHAQRRVHIGQLAHAVEALA